jgi:hypothetical protein
MQKKYIPLALSTVSSLQAGQRRFTFICESIEDARTFLASQYLDVDALAKDIEGKFISAFIRANKPATASCCAPSCCSQEGDDSFAPHRRGTALLANSRKSICNRTWVKLLSI